MQVFHAHTIDAEPFATIAVMIRFRHGSIQT